jgi:hypothetical protein
MNSHMQNMRSLAVSNIGRAFRAQIAQSKALHIGFIALRPAERMR